MFQGKEVSVRLGEEADKVYLELNSLVGEEKLKGINSSFHQTLLRSIHRVRDLLKQNPFAGDQVPKRQIPINIFKSLMQKMLGELNWQIGGDWFIR